MERDEQVLCLRDAGVWIIGPSPARGLKETNNSIFRKAGLAEHSLVDPLGIEPPGIAGSGNETEAGPSCFRASWAGRVSHLSASDTQFDL
jgi:hypothetical protein